MVKPGDVLGGKYRIETVLGEGGMGLVVAATHVLRGDRLALKLLNPGSAGSSVGLARFDREARAASRIESEHVAKVLDVGVTGFGAPFMVMEHLDGSDLASVLEAGGPLPVEEAAVYVLQACEGVAVAHDHGIIHRDLKPANLFLTAARGGGPCVKVLDFGLSKLSADTGAMSITTSCTILGTPLYMAPEQFASPREVDPRADVWALGVCLYELLTGEVPFCEQNLHRQYALLITKTPDRPSSKRHDIPRALDDVILKCLRRDPEERFESVRALAAAITAAVPSGARSRVASLNPDTIRGRTRSLVTMRPLTSSMDTLVESSSSSRRRAQTTSTTFKILKPLQGLPGGVLAWAAAAIASMAIAAVFVVRAHTSAAASEPSPIVLYTAASARAHRTLETTGAVAVPTSFAGVRSGELAASVGDAPASQTAPPQAPAQAAPSSRAPQATPAPHAAPARRTPARAGGRGSHGPKEAARETSATAATVASRK